MNADLAATSIMAGKRAIPLGRSNALFRWNAVLSLCICSKPSPFSRCCSPRIRL